MNETGQNKILFVINPISGGKEKTDHQDAIKKYYQERPTAIEFFLLDGKNDAEELPKCIEQVKPYKVIAVGGDGTVSMVAKKLLKTERLHIRKTLALIKIRHH